MNKKIVAIELTSAWYPCSDERHFAGFIHRAFVVGYTTELQRCKYYDRLSRVNIRRFRAMQDALAHCESKMASQDDD